MKAGHKVAVVGSVPDSWDFKKLQEISAFITKGGTPTTYGFDWATEIDGIPFFRSECVTDDGFFEKGMNYISIAAHNKMLRSEVMTGDLLMTITGNIGRVARAPKKFERANINQHIARIRIEPGIDIDYIYHCLKHEGYAKYYSAILTGQAYPQISLQQVRETTVALPIVPEQQKIATILTTVDDKLDVISCQISATNILKQGLMQTLFRRGMGTQDADGRWVPHTEFKDSELGEIPMGWEETLIGKVGELKNGINKSKESFGHGDQFVNLMDVFGKSSIKKGIFGLVETSDREREDFSLKKGDFLFVRSSVKPTGVGLTALVEEDIPNSVYSGFLIRMRITKRNICGDYLKHFLWWDSFRAKLLAKSTISANTNINQGALSSLPIVLPEIDEQKYIGAILNAIDEKIVKLASKQTHYQTLKRGLMQKLLTGEWRVKLDEEAVHGD